MLKLLIVDDEQSILDGLKMIINWNEIGVEMIGTAGNGIDALELALKQKPDIVLTDIRMPEMNGLELIRNLSIKLPKTRCILLTGYQEFEYVREALKYGAAGYILKPVDESELCEVIQSIREKLISDAYQNNKLEDLNQKLLKTASYMRNQLLFSIVNGEGYNLDEITPMLNSYGIKSFPERYVCFIMDIDLDQGNSIFNTEDSELVKFAAANIAEEVLKYTTEGIVFYTHETKIIGLMDVKQNEASRVENVIREMLVNIKKFLKLSIAVGISTAQCGMKSMSTGYKEAKRALKYKMIAGDIIYYRNIEESIEIIYNVPLKTEKKLINCIICGDSKGIPNIVNELYEDLYNAKVGIEGFLFGFKDVMSLIRRNMAEMGYDVSTLIQHDRVFFENAENCSLTDLKSGIIKLLTNLTMDISTLNIGGGKSLISQIKQYIDENYSEQLTLNAISDKFYIHSSYFSRLFKKETSENFIDYLTKKRIEEGKRLLLGTDFKIYEIAEKIGYGNPKYFSQLFEKHTGTSPKEYRDLKSRNTVE